MKKALFALLIFGSGCSTEKKQEWRELFNGNDLSGWNSWLATPHPSYDVPGLARDSAGNYTQPLGLNNDPLGVFTVAHDGEDAFIHISGQGWGALTTEDEFENFHLSLEYKWGERRWAPRDSAKRDSGILYFCVGKNGAASDAWMQSQECQVQEGDTGDYWSVAGGIVDVKAEKVTIEGKEYLQYSPRGETHTIGREFDGKNWDKLRCLKRSTHEKPHGEWNKVEVIAYGGTVVHVVNGEPVMVIENSRHVINGNEVPLVKGRIQLQSEGAEVFYRNVKIRAIMALPKWLSGREL